MSRLRSGTTEALARAIEDLGAAVRGLDAAAWSRRPDDRNWSPKEIVCHLRDVEELFVVRVIMTLAMDEPKILAFGAALPPGDRRASRRPLSLRPSGRAGTTIRAARG